MRGVGAIRLAQAAERVRWQLVQAYRQLARQGAINEEHLREVEWLVEHLGEVPADQLRARLVAIARQAAGTEGGAGT